MEICFMNGDALFLLKKSLPTTFQNYFGAKDNSWLAKVCGGNPFVKFRDVPDFELAPLNENLSAGEIEFRNCKILYKHLKFLTPRQAADERLWAGLCHGVFYDYLRRRYKYDVTEPTAAKEIRTRFFFEATSLTGILRNTLAKCWWTGRAFFDATRNNVFEKLEILGANDISSKISYILRYSFTANPTILNGIVNFFKHFKDEKKSLGALKETLQPAMAELNKAGGARILDCLTETEIAAIMIEYVEKILSHKNPRTIKPVEKIPAPKKPVVFDTRTVKMGSKVKVVSLYGVKSRDYGITDPFKKRFSDIYAELIGKKINSVVTLRDGKFTITDIQ